MTTISDRSDLSLEPHPHARDVRETLARILASDEFLSSPRLADFLRYVVETTLAGRAEEIKGYTIALEALGRPSSFDPQADPIVRVEATRLRRGLERYYSCAGAQDSIEILIPKGTYVPTFRVRDIRSEPAPLPDPAVLVPEAASDPVAPQVRRHRWLWLWGAGAAGLVLLVLLVQLAVPTLERGPASLTIAFGNQALSPADLADRMGVPILNVRQFEVTGTPGASVSDIHVLEERLRDAFARFDFVDVMSAGAGAKDRECKGDPPRSVFALGGLVEGHEDGSTSLLLRLTDRCEGTIVWSTQIDGIRQLRDAQWEQQLVREVAGTLMTHYGVVPARARAQARVAAPNSGFACLAKVFSLLRGEDSGLASGARACLDRLVSHDHGYGVVHALKALLLIYDLRQDLERDADPVLLHQMRREAEQGAELAPTSAFAARVLAHVRYVLGQTEEAQIVAERAMVLNPLDYDAVALAGMILIGRGEVERGESLLRHAREHGARSPHQDVYIALAVFLRSDSAAAAVWIPAFQNRTSPFNRIALALLLRAAGRGQEEEAVVGALVRETPGGLAGLRRAIRYLLPREEIASPVLGEIEAASRAHSSLTSFPSRG